MTESKVVLRSSLVQRVNQIGQKTSASGKTPSIELSPNGLVLTIHPITNQPNACSIDTTILVLANTVNHIKAKTQ